MDNQSELSHQADQMPSWPVHIILGDVKTPEGVKVVDLTPAAISEDSIIQALLDSNLKTADLRTRCVFHVNYDARAAAAVYAALIGFAGRRIDILTGDQVVEAQGVDAAVQSYTDTLPTRPDDADDQIQVGAVHHSLPSVAVNGVIDTVSAARIRHARRVRLVPSEGATAQAVADTLSSLLTVAALRQRGSIQRLPWLVIGDEEYTAPVVKEKVETELSQFLKDTEEDTTIDPSVEAADTDLNVDLSSLPSPDPKSFVKLPKPVAEKGAVGVDLEGLRRRGEQLRSSNRLDERGQIVDKIEPNQRQIDLTLAAAKPIEETLVRLGATATDDPGTWFCTNAYHKANPKPSVKISKGKAQCFICDPERLDSLRLVMNTKQLTPDEAADWLLSAK